MKLKIKPLIDNWPAKVLSLAAAIVLLVFHRMSSLDERFFSVPLRIEQAGSMAPASTYPRMIRVTLRGNSGDVQTVLDSDIEVFVDLGSPTAKGIAHYPVQVRKKGTALEVEALEISTEPIGITLELDERVSKFVAIAPRIQGRTAAGYEITGYSLNPSRIRIDGPDGIVRRIAELPTELIDITERNADFTVITRAVNADQLVSIQGDSVVEYHAVVRAALIIRTIDAVPIAAENLAPGLAVSVEPASLSLRLEGAQNTLETWSPIVTLSSKPAVGAVDAADASATAPVTETEGLPYTRSVLYVDCAGITEAGDYELEVKADLPASFSLLGTANQASALNAALPVVRVSVREAE